MKRVLSFFVAGIFCVACFCLLCACSKEQIYFFSLSNSNVSINEGETICLQDMEYSTNADVSNIKFVCASQILQIENQSIFAKSKGDAVVDVVFAPTNTILFKFNVKVLRVVEVQIDTSNNNQNQNDTPPSQDENHEQNGQTPQGESTNSSQNEGENGQTQQEEQNNSEQGDAGQSGAQQEEQNNSEQGDAGQSGAQQEEHNSQQNDAQHGGTSQEEQNESQQENTGQEEQNQPEEPNQQIDNNHGEFEQHNGEQQINVPEVGGLTFKASVRNVDDLFDRYTFEIFKNNSFFANYSFSASSQGYCEINKNGYTLFVTVSKSVDFEIVITDLEDNLTIVLKNLGN